MRKQITLRIILVLIVLIFAILPVAAMAEDTNVKAKSPGYDIVVGKDVTFKWQVMTSRTQDSFRLRTNVEERGDNTGKQDYKWYDFPFGSGWWDVQVYNWKNQVQRIGTTSQQNFYHYNNLSNTTNYRPEPFEYRRGARDLEQSRDLTIFYELTKDYRINLNRYFALGYDPWFVNQVLDGAPPTAHKDLQDHVSSRTGIESAFIKLDNGVLTLKKGYRWDGTSNPFVWEENPTDLRSSGVHDAIYDLMRMGYLVPDTSKPSNYWSHDGYKNRLMADIMHYAIAVEDRDKTKPEAYSDFIVLRFGGQGKTQNNNLLLPFKYHVSELTAWVTKNGKIDLHWLPANMRYEDPKAPGTMKDDDPKNYYVKPHHYDIYRTTSDSSNWSYITTKIFGPNDMNDHNDATVYFTDLNVVSGEIYYYRIEANDLDTDGDGWTDQEEDDNPGGNYKRPWKYPYYNKKHHDESFVEAVTPAIGPGNALQLNGLDQYVISTSEPNIDSGYPWTFEAWVYPEDDGNNFGTILHSSDLNNTNYNSLVYSNQTDQFCYSNWSVDDPNLPCHCSEEGLITPGYWYHLAVTINDSEIVLYVDGVPEVNITPLFDYPETTPTFSIGANCEMNKWRDPNGGELKSGAFAYKNIITDFFKGKIDELRVWSVARTEAEIQENMFVPLRGDHEDLVALWHFDEPDGTHTAYDATINGRDGEVNEASFVTSDVMMNNNNVAPEVDAGPDDTINEGDTFVGSGSFTDPDSNEWTATVNYGDGSGVQSLTLTGKTFDLSHIYADNGVYTVTVTVTDDYGDAGTDTMVVNVISPQEAVTVINNSIQDLPEDAFENNSDNLKNAFSNKLDVVVKLINEGAYQNAIDKLQNDIRAKIDGYVEANPGNDWIIDQGAQEKLCTMIDDLIAYLETML